MIHAKELMTPNPVIVQTNDDPKDILMIFLAKKFTAVPVGDTNGEIIGVLGEMNLVRIMVQHSVDGKGKRIGNYASSLEKAAFVNEGDNLGTVVKCMAASSTHRVLVRNAAEKVVGVISPKDLLKVLAGQHAADKSA